MRKARKDKDKVEFEASLERYKAIIDLALEEYLSGSKTDVPVLREAMFYAATGGKRLRGAIVLAVCEELEGVIEDALGLAMAIEMVHAYSLVHDDLPCMDDDDMRRGKPSCHRKYGEAVALLCGDALLTAAFEVAANCGMASAAGRIRAIGILASAAGAHGMVAGQVLDLGLGGALDTVDAVTQVYRLKTGRLFEASAKMGAIAALASDEAIQTAGSWGLHFGYAFQIADDLEDLVAEAGKTTLVQLTSPRDAREEAVESLRASLATLSRLPGKQRFLEALSLRYLDLLSTRSL